MLNIHFSTRIQNKTRTCAVLQQYAVNDLAWRLPLHVTLTDRASHDGRPRFRSQLEDRVSALSLSWFYSIPPGISRDNALNRPRPFASTSFTALSSVASSYDAMCSELLIASLNKQTHTDRATAENEAVCHGLFCSRFRELRADRWDRLVPNHKRAQNPLEEITSPCNIKTRIKNCVRKVRAVIRTETKLSAV